MKLVKLASCVVKLVEKTVLQKTILANALVASRLLQSPIIGMDGHYCLVSSLRVFDGVFWCVQCKILTC